MKFEDCQIDKNENQLKKILLRYDLKKSAHDSAYLINLTDSERSWPITNWVIRKNLWFVAIRTKMYPNTQISIELVRVFDPNKA